MTQSIKNNFDYDSEYDILNIYFSSTQNSAGEENIDNIVEFRDATTKNLTRLMIYQFKKMFESKDARLSNIADVANIDKYYKNISKKDKAHYGY